MEMNELHPGECRSAALTKNLRLSDHTPSSEQGPATPVCRAYQVEKTTIFTFPLLASQKQQLCACFGLTALL